MKIQKHTQYIKLKRLHNRNVNEISKLSVGLGELMDRVYILEQKIKELQQLKLSIIGSEEKS